MAFFRTSACQFLGISRQICRFSVFFRYVDKMLSNFHKLIWNYSEISYQISILVVDIFLSHTITIRCFGNIFLLQKDTYWQYFVLLQRVDSLCWAQVFVRLASILGPVITGSLMDDDKTNFLFYGLAVLVLAAALAIFCVPETVAVLEEMKPFYTPQSSGLNVRSTSNPLRHA